jgi:hypothetical protein
MLKLDLYNTKFRGYICKHERLLTIPVLWDDFIYSDIYCPLNSFRRNDQLYILQGIVHVRYERAGKICNIRHIQRLSELLIVLDMFAP